MDKKQLSIEILLVIIIAIYGILHGDIASKKIGSSDNPLTLTGNVDNLLVIESSDIKVGITTTDNKIRSVLFLSEASNALYNKNIENKEVNTGINKILDIIDKTNNVKEISITYYKGKLRIKDLVSSYCKKKVMYL